MDLVGWLSWATNVQASSVYFRTRTNLQKHVSWFNSAICCHSPSFHNRANVYATITPVIALSYNADSQEVILFYTDRKWRVGGKKANKMIGIIVKSYYQATSVSNTQFSEHISWAMFDLQLSQVTLLAYVCLARSGKGSRETLLKTLFFHTGHRKVTFKKSARETTSKRHVYT